MNDILNQTFITREIISKLFNDQFGMGSHRAPYEADHRFHQSLSKAEQYFLL